MTLTLLVYLYLTALGLVAYNRRHGRKIVKKSMAEKRRELLRLNPWFIEHFAEYDLKVADYASISFGGAAS